MFYYYGAKRQLAARYPRPAFPVIVEPFAGSASYAMAHLPWVERVVLVEKDPRVAALWRRLLAMTPEEVLAWPIPAEGEKTDDFLLMTAATSNAVARCRWMTVTARMTRVVPGMLRGIARLLPLAQERVELIEGSYAEAPDIEASWFIDPPYQVNGRASGKTAFPQGMGYAAGCDAEALDFAALGQWAQARRGQVVVCEQWGATWLPFAPLGTTFDSSGAQSSEVVWQRGEMALF